MYVILLFMMCIMLILIGLFGLCSLRAPCLLSGCDNILVNVTSPFNRWEGQASNRAALEDVGGQCVSRAFDSID